MSAPTLDRPTTRDEIGVTATDLPPGGPPDRGFFGHPRGLATLFFTEMWERFSYYGMRALLILFMVATVEKGGLGFPTSRAGAVYGMYTALAYLATLAIEPRKTLDGFTPEQRVFLGWAQVWCENRRPEALRMMAQTNPHSPGRYRVNGVVTNMPEFQKAFSCKADAPMVRQKACRVW